MSFSDQLKDVQTRLIEQKISGWLLYDCHGSNPLIYSFLEIPIGNLTTRRFFYWIPQRGDPIKIVSSVEPYALDHLPGLTWIYHQWQELERFLYSLASQNSVIAMEYSPYNSLPAISKVDAGTVDLLRRGGADVVSSANLLQPYANVWTQEQFDSHLEAAEMLQAIIESTWRLIADSLANGKALNEWQVQRFMSEEIEKRGGVSADLPICAVNEHSADPHYSPRRDKSFTIKKNDWILLDIWCKKMKSNAVYADIARVGVAAAEPTSKQQEIFSIVRQAQENATRFMREAHERKERVEGWQVDRVCRETIRQAGYENYFIHRTGHNIGTEVHGSGANLDDLETHDFRVLLPGMCFSIEPGIYLPEQFGIRLEYDVYLAPDFQLRVTGGEQESIVCLTL